MISGVAPLRHWRGMSFGKAEKEVGREVRDALVSDHSPRKHEPIVFCRFDLLRKNAFYACWQCRPVQEQECLTVGKTAAINTFVLQKQDERPTARWSTRISRPTWAKGDVTKSGEGRWGHGTSRKGEQHVVSLSVRGWLRATAAASGRTDAHATRSCRRRRRSRSPTVSSPPGTRKSGDDVCWHWPINSYRRRLLFTSEGDKNSRR